MDITASKVSAAKKRLKSTDSDSRYSDAMVLKEQGKLEEAAEILLSACITPSIFHGHYQQLFIIWRAFNKRDLKEGQYRQVIDRIRNMIQLNDEMIECMSSYWSQHFHEEVSAEYFDLYSNVLIYDANALLKAAEAINDVDNLKLAVKLINGYMAKKASKPKSS
ncbi:hypothetical protein [Aquirhabdus parva]|uniref:Uncharacterized protein n=1 Tax=Aquirhabdus parva TaxID=2283318 RepID=A0A345P9Q9_9GAMM|nr:hypothetical protein [Aquirhabdus parva]AXI04018.1 hypothetical protein HYN46_14910 [Aquirhabdus parva]